MQFWSLTGLTPYESARELQLKLVDLRAQDRVPDTVLFLEHEAVVTRGRGLQFTGTPRLKHMPMVTPLPTGVAFAESERGGDLTYHGPGQLVVYPIVKLDGQGFGPNHDIAGFLRKFERVFIDLIAQISHGAATAESRENATGVWVRPTDRAESPPKKIASMGIAIRRWVTYHGLAINCVNDLKSFHLISPCGYSPEVMTRLLDVLSPETPEAQALQEWSARGRQDFETRLVALLASSGHRGLSRLSVGDALAQAERAGG